MTVTGKMEYRVLNIMESHHAEEFGQINYELLGGHVVFSYLLPGDPNADAEPNPDLYDCEDEYV